MVARLADVDYNLSHIKELAISAIRDGAKVIALPEFFTTSIVFGRRLWRCSLPEENKALDMLIDLARTNDVLLGGSYLEKRGRDVYNTYVLVQPDGTVTKHDKDRPTMVENAFYTGGSDDGCHDTFMGRVGTAVCWETIRTDTVKRLKGRIDFLMTGSHWWSPPLKWYIGDAFFRKMAQQNLEYMAAAPAEIARLLGVSNMHAAHAGPIDGRILLFPTDRLTGKFNAHLMGETQIINNNGAVKARMKREEGAGFITAEVELTSAKPTLELSERFWIPHLTTRFKFFWYHQNICGKRMYQYAKENELLVALEQ